MHILDKIGLILLHISLAHALEWTETPGELCTCEGDDVTLSWRFTPSGDVTVPAYSFLYTETVPRSLLYVKVTGENEQQMQQYAPKYANRTQFLGDDVTPKLKLQRVTPLDSGGYCVILSGVEPNERQNGDCNLRVIADPIVSIEDDTQDQTGDINPSTRRVMVSYSPKKTDAEVFIHQGAQPVQRKEQCPSPCVFELFSTEPVSAMVRFCAGCSRTSSTITFNAADETSDSTNTAVIVTICIIVILLVASIIAIVLWKKGILKRYLPVHHYSTVKTDTRRKSVEPIVKTEGPHLPPRNSMSPESLTDDVVVPVIEEQTDCNTYTNAKQAENTDVTGTDGHDEPDTAVAIEHKNTDGDNTTEHVDMPSNKDEVTNNASTDTMTNPCKSEEKQHVSTENHKESDQSNRRADIESDGNKIVPKFKANGSGHKDIESDRNANIPRFRATTSEYKTYASEAKCAVDVRNDSDNEMLPVDGITTSNLFYHKIAQKPVIDLVHVNYDKVDEANACSSKPTMSKGITNEVSEEEPLIEPPTNNGAHDHDQVDNPQEHVHVRDQIDNLRKETDDSLDQIDNTQDQLGNPHGKIDNSHEKLDELHSETKDKNMTMTNKDSDVKLTVESPTGSKKKKSKTNCIVS